MHLDLVPSSVNLSSDPWKGLVTKYDDEFAMYNTESKLTSLSIIYDIRALFKVFGCVPHLL